MGRVRTQVYLEQEQHRWLREEAQMRDVSMTELLRQIIAERAGGRQPRPSREAFLSITRLGHSGLDDISEQHDRCLAEIVADEHLC